jgi:hypothetical protein
MGSISIVFVQCQTLRIKCNMIIVAGSHPADADTRMSLHPLVFSPFSTNDRQGDEVVLCMSCVFSTRQLLPESNSFAVDMVQCAKPAPFVSYARRKLHQIHNDCTEWENRSSDTGIVALNGWFARSSCEMRDAFLLESRKRMQS